MSPAILQPLGAMTGLLAIWLVLIGVRNGFVAVLIAVALVLLGIGEVMK